MTRRIATAATAVLLAVACNLPTRAKQWLTFLRRLLNDLLRKVNIKVCLLSEPVQSRARTILLSTLR